MGSFSVRRTDLFLVVKGVKAFINGGTISIKKRELFGWLAWKTS